MSNSRSHSFFFLLFTQFEYWWVCDLSFILYIQYSLCPNRVFEEQWRKSIKWFEETMRWKILLPIFELDGWKYKRNMVVSTRANGKNIFDWVCIIYILTHWLDCWHLRIFSMMKSEYYRPFEKSSALHIILYTTRIWNMPKMIWSYVVWPSSWSRTIMREVIWDIFVREKCLKSDSLHKTFFILSPPP